MKEVLYIAPGNQNSKGGIGLCVNNYSKHMDDFKVLLTHRFHSKIVNTLWFPFCMLELWFRLIRDSEIKIVHIHGASKGSFYRKYLLFSLVRTFFHKKIIYHVHGGGFQDFYLKSPVFIQKRVRYVMHSADLVVCLSEKWKLFFTSAFRPKRVVIVNNMVIPPINTDRIKQNGKFQLLFLGLIGDNKGVFDLLKVIVKYRSKFENKLILRIAGNGETIRLVNDIKKLKLEKLVHFEGWADSIKKEQLFRTSDAFILTSYKEGLPLSILEAMSYGLPVIASKVGGIPDLLYKYRNGLLVKPGDLATIKNAIDKFLQNEALLQTFSQRSADGAADFYPQAVLKTLFSIYHELQGNKGFLFEQN
ncbi:glycosyltransferase family 4 protein [Ancylomarina longa]|uniref:Glycosyltransferase family 1 protein n=1 Tax=Ancylomarina longa TaxID=2487017 RepID=A0A434ATX0_9BACT|nr:glycosyltransferase family 4 protein [Ancylomarina longa]RUT77880.1 glycosyltransferase family 1 protein [Ancylomarina longa]